MKAQQILTKMSLVLLLAVFGTACAKKNDSDGSSSTGTTGTTGGTPVDTTTNTGSGTDSFAGDPGASAPLTADSLAVLNTYVATHPVNNPQNLRVYLELKDEGSGRIGGTVKIRYYDNGQYRTGTFTTTNPNGNTTNQVSYHDWYKGKPNSEFNQWFTSGGKRVFHGFFQDAYGAIVVVIDGGLDLGDGGGITEASGSVYFKNFRLAPAPQYIGGAGEMCWFLLPPSPYECGTFKAGDQVSTTSALYPSSSDGYTRLGTFVGLKKSRAFQ